MNSDEERLIELLGKPDSIDTDPAEFIAREHRCHQCGYTEQSTKPLTVPCPNCDSIGFVRVRTLHS